MKESINDRIERLEQELATLKELSKDNRVYFNREFTFNLEYNEQPAAIAEGIAQDGDKHKVLVAGKGYHWELHKDYYKGCNAVSLHRDLYR